MLIVSVALLSVYPLLLPSFCCIVHGKIMLVYKIPYATPKSHLDFTTCSCHTIQSEDAHVSLNCWCFSPTSPSMWFQVSSAAPLSGHEVQWVRPTCVSHYNTPPTDSVSWLAESVSPDAVCILLFLYLQSKKDYTRQPRSESTTCICWANCTFRTRLLCIVLFDSRYRNSKK